MKWFVLILVLAGIWWVYNNTSIVDDSAKIFRSKSMVDTVQKTRENRFNAVEEQLSR